MKQIAVMLTAAFVFVFAVAAQADEPVTLKTDALVTGDALTLGHLFDGLAPDAAARAIARAPAPGTEVVLDAAWVVRVARAYGVAWQPAGAVEGVRLRRATAEEAAALAEAEAADLSAAIAAAAQPLPPAEPAEVPQPVATDVAEPATVAVPVPTRRIRTGEVIDSGDIAWVDMAESGRTANWVLDAAEIVGMSADRQLAADRPIRPTDLRRPIDVTRGDGVTMVLRHGALVLTARGRALDDGAEGERIRVVNVDSNRTVEATVTGPETVEVRTGSATADLAHLN